MQEQQQTAAAPSSPFVAMQCAIAGQLPRRNGNALVYELLYMRQTEEARTKQWCSDQFEATGSVGSSYAYQASPCRRPLSLPTKRPRRISYKRVREAVPNPRLYALQSTTSDVTPFRPITCHRQVHSATRLC
jgi:hypothetical protein